MQKCSISILQKNTAPIIPIVADNVIRKLFTQGQVALSKPTVYAAWRN